jgi:CRISPR-associated endonuclease Csn1
MKTKKILGLDIGTNSIGGALINIPKSFEDYGKEGSIEWIGSRIIPLDGDYLQKFESGSQTETKAAFRRVKRGSRRLKHRYKLRRTRLTQVFKILGWLNEDFPENFKKKIRDDENFKFSIQDYLPFSEQTIAEATKELGVKNKNGKLAFSEDWIIYYLRKKALTEKITFSELARIIYMMNQRRGFKSSRKDLKEGDIKEIKWVEILKIKSVEQESEEKNKKGNHKYIITPYSDKVKPWAEERKKKPEWEEKEFTFLITEKTDEKGKVSQLKPQLPKPDDWALCTTAQDNKMGNKHPGEYFYDGLKESKSDFKIRQYAVYRSKYKKELESIWQIQLEKNDELRKLNTDKEVLQKLVEKLYPTQAKAKMSKLNEFISKNLIHIISNDIIYYQRELKSQKSSISECQYENKKGIDGEIYGIKCSPKSSPDFQEFRIWQDIHNIRVFEKEKKVEGYTKIDVDVTPQFINPKVKEELFEKFDRSKEINQENVFKILNNNSEIKITEKTHRINMFFKADKKISGNEIKYYFRKAFSKCRFEAKGEILLDDREKLYKLWHILYSISSSDSEKSVKGISSALGNKKNLFDLPPEVIETLSNSPEIEKQKKYASYSTKAIRKLLPLMRIGKYWNENEIPTDAKEKAKKINERLEEIHFNERKINEIADDDIQKQLLKSFLKTENTTQGLNTYQACYLVYDRHSEKINDKTYSSINEFDILKLIPNNSLRNPVVEQVVRETLHLVKDIWKKYGQPDEIHIELGRELKKNMDEKKKATDSNNKNFDEKQRIKKLLYELINDKDGFEEYDNNENKVISKFSVKPNPDSPKDIDKFRIWKSGSSVKDDEFEKLFKDGNKERIPTKVEIKKYILWLSQGCCSPYTGKIIPLSKLFDKTEYEIEHVIPQSKFANDSFNNLVIAEAAINPSPYKGSMLARNFIKHFGGEIGKELVISNRKYFILGESEYENRCKDTFKHQKGKLKNLLATEVPEDFVTRQLNDTRYITRKVTELLSPIAKDKTGIIFTGGSVTSELKKKWGLNKEWKKLLFPRFKRLEEINKKEYILQSKFDANDIDINVPENPELELKRIDHRHHALDALIIAATSREHIRYLNSLSAVDSDEELKRVRQTLVKGKIREFKTPWEKFTEDARKKLEETIVSFKTNNKIVSKPSNKYTKWERQSDGSFEKVYVKQLANPKWMAVRKSMFKEPQGIVYIKEIITKSFRTPKEMMDIVKLQIARMEAQNTPKQKNTSYIYDQETREIVKNIIDLSGGSVEAIEKYLKKFKPVNSNGDKIYTVGIAVFTEYAAKRVTLDKSFDHTKINKIPYAKNGKSVIGKLLHDHLNGSEYGDDPSLAFSGEGLEALSKKAGTPITKVTIAEQKSSESKFRNQYVEIDAGSNAYFVIYENEITKEREDYKSLATHKAIERLVKGEPLAEEKEGFRSIIISPNDLVYVPTKEERLKIKNNISIEEAIDWNNKKKIFERTYKMMSCTKKECHFIPHFLSKPIIDTNELGSNNKSEKAWDGIVSYEKNNKEKETRKDTGTIIKEVCVKLRIDRLGNIKSV